MATKKPFLSYWLNIKASCEGKVDCRKSIKTLLVYSRSRDLVEERARKVESDENEYIKRIDESCNVEVEVTGGDSDGYYAYPIEASLVIPTEGDVDDLRGDDHPLSQASREQIRKFRERLKS